MEDLRLEGAASLWATDVTFGLDVYYYPAGIVWGLKGPITSHFLRAWSIAWSKIHNPKNEINGHELRCELHKVTPPALLCQC